MNTQELYQNICRICLNENVVLNWNNTLFECYGVTYKDCYYKYTNLEYLDDDPFSCMLCENCINILQNMHTLVLKAVESYKYFTESKLLHGNNIATEGSVNEQKEVKYTPLNEFEIVVMEKRQKGSKEEKIDNELTKDTLEVDESLCLQTGKGIENSYELKIEKSEDEEFLNPRENLKSNDNLDSETMKSKHKTKKSRCKIEKDNTEDKETKIKKNNLQSERKAKKKRSYVCPICSKVFSSLHTTKAHEQTHAKDRKRNETCEICGLKFYHRYTLKEHLLTHNKDREKTHKCDFCDKAFYNKSSLNVHCRKHLGQTVSCTLCNKEFVRQIDLDLHMNNQHSANTLNGETRKRSRYMIRCKHCNKSMLSTSFRSHIAVHLNQPLMKCLLCDKEFFRRESCTFHLKNKHKKSTDVYNEFILIYEKKRLSHLFLEQTAEIISEDEE